MTLEIAGASICMTVELWALLLPLEVLWSWRNLA